jgi:hypothetical protein
VIRHSRHDRYRRSLRAAKTIIRVTLERDAYTGWRGQQRPAATLVREFEDTAVADNWFVHDSYFAETYTAKATWERVSVPADYTIPAERRYR